VYSRNGLPVVLEERRGEEVHNVRTGRRRRRKGLTCLNEFASGTDTS